MPFHNLEQRITAGTPTNSSISGLGPPTATDFNASGPAAAPAAAAGLPPALAGLADASAAATLGAKGSHVLLLSITTVGGFCVVVLVLTAVVLCVICHRRRKRDAYTVERKPSQSGSDKSNRGAALKPSPQMTTPKGLRQAYAKASGRHQGNEYLLFFIARISVWHDCNW